MADVDALLEEAFSAANAAKAQGEKPKDPTAAPTSTEPEGESRSRKRSRSRSNSRQRRRSDSRDRYRRRRRRSQSPRHRHRRRRSRSPRDRYYDRRDRGRRERSLSRDRRRGRAGRDYRRSRSPTRSNSPSRRKMTKEELAAHEAERDTRSAFVQGLMRKISGRDLKEWFAEKQVKVRAVRLITDRATGKSKGFGYIEFESIEDLRSGLTFNGQLLGRCAVQLRPSEAEKNYAGTKIAEHLATKQPVVAVADPNAKIYVGSLDYNIGENDLRALFDPLTPGALTEVTLHREAGGQSKGFAFLQFLTAEAAQKAFALNGFELVGRPMKVGYVNGSGQQPPPVVQLPPSATGAVPGIVPGVVPGQPAAILGNGNGAGVNGAAPGVPPPQPAAIVSDQAVGVHELNDTGGGLKMDASKRAQLMARLAGGAASDVIANQQSNSVLNTIPAQLAAANPPVTEGLSQLPTCCLALRNMFDPNTETDPNFDLDIKEDVGDEISKFGPLQHILVDKTSQVGRVWVKMGNTASAIQACNALNGRWFAGKQIVVEFIVQAQYDAMFPESVQQG